jgi:hypothetical protein
MHDQIPALVPLIDFLLAPGAGGVGALSPGVADSIAISDRRHRRGRGVGVGKRNYLSARSIVTPNRVGCFRYTQPIKLIIDVPDELSRALAHSGQDLPRSALEAITLEAGLA